MVIARKQIEKCNYSVRERT